jgi:D-alanyl-D-alanine dipeptidase
MRAVRCSASWLAAVRLALALALASCASPPDPPSQRAASPRRSTSPAPAAPAPASDDLVDLGLVAPAIRLDLRYATRDNFTGRAVYPAARCLLRRDVAERLVRVQAGLAAAGLGLKVWDCYRPFSVQEALWQLVPDPRYVARPVRRGAELVEGSKHNRGAAVDLTLVDLDGAELDMPTGFDDFSSRAHRGDPSASPAARASAARLEAAMVVEGFEPLPTEWWHFDAPGWQAYPLADQPLQP